MPTSLRRAKPHARHRDPRLLGASRAAMVQPPLQHTSTDATSERMDANHGGNPHLELVARAVATPHGRGVGHVALRPRPATHTPHARIPRVGRQKEKGTKDNKR